jgi:two-component system, OmpR family, alkaline phosphatase synthesis response regulator PhoP
MAKTVLVIDDDPGIVKIVASHLRAGSYTVITALDGEDGLRQCKIHKPDLVILDVMMPGISGDLVAQTMSDDPALCRTPIIFLTGIIKKEEVKDALTTEFQYYLAKPFKGAELLKLIQRALGGGAPAI